MDTDADVLVAGAGPAGSATAIFLALQGWRVLLLEQHSYPRNKVCGECVSAGALKVLDMLDVGAQFRRRAGPELRWLGWMRANSTVTANMPAGLAQDYRYGHAIGRDSLDTLLLDRARAVGVEVIQPARLRDIAGSPGMLRCVYQMATDRISDGGATGVLRSACVPLVVDALGSREPGHHQPIGNCGVQSDPRARRQPSDLLAFKASFRNTTLPTGLLPLIALRGGYGGMVVANEGRTTIACCVRRDLLDRCRMSASGRSAGAAIEAYLRGSSRGIRDALEGAERQGSWLSVGPVRPGVRPPGRDGIFRVGNAAGEPHPLVGEGIGMALQSALMLSNHLKAHEGGFRDADDILSVQRKYGVAWHRQFAARIRLSSIYARLVMRPALAAPADMLLRGSPALLTLAARLAGKARPPVSPCQV